VKRYTDDDHVTLVMELFLVFGMPFVDGKDSMPLVFRNMTAAGGRHAEGWAHQRVSGLPYGVAKPPSHTVYDV
jgi:hypothetical protein